MIAVVASQTVRAEEIENFKAIAAQLVEATNAKDEGCVSYALFQDLEQPKILTFIENWESEAALSKHMAAPHFTAFFPQLGALTEGEGTVTKYEKL